MRIIASLFAIWTTLLMFLSAGLSFAGLVVAFIQGVPDRYIIAGIWAIVFLMTLGVTKK